MSKHWNFDEARGLKAIGMSWTEIGQIFGVTAGTAHKRCDPEYASRRRSQINERRRMLQSSLGHREHVRRVEPEPIVSQPLVPKGPFMTANGMVYQKFKHGQVISLPFVSILGREG